MPVRHFITESQFLRMCKLRSERMDVRSISDRMGLPYSSVRSWLRSETMSMLVVRFFGQGPEPSTSAAQVVVRKKKGRKKAA